MWFAIVICYIRLDILYYQKIDFELTVCGKKRQRGRRGDRQMNGRISQRWIDRGQQLHGRASLKIMSLLRISKVEAEKIFKIGNIITFSTHKMSYIYIICKIRYIDITLYQNHTEVSLLTFRIKVTFHLIEYYKYHQF